VIGVTGGIRSAGEFGSDRSEKTFKKRGETGDGGDHDGIGRAANLGIEAVVKM
jgi:hypothetical protein